MMSVEVSIKNDKGAAKIFQMKQTAEPVEKKNGGTTLAHFQPEADCKAIKSFSKLYIDLEEIKK
jgi:hypothetical protein